MVLVNALQPVATNRVFIVTSPIQSGKTTSLVNWSEKRNDVYGILTPEVDGKRMFMDAHTRQLFLMEAKEGETELLSVGRFVFSKTNFEKAIQIIRDGMDKEGWLLIDEIGPMELRGEGFSEVLKDVLATRQYKILIVVRDKDNMVEKVKEYFNITEATSLPGAEAIKKLSF
jgi:nucleoside-triphosphatase THEP1